MKKSRVLLDDQYDTKRGIDFFDQNGDGKIDLYDSYKSFRILGVGRLLAVIFAICFNSYLAIACFSWSIPSLVAIDVAKLYESKRILARGLFTKELVDNESFDREFRRFDTSKSGKISLLQALVLMRIMKCRGISLFLASVNCLVLGFLWWLAADQDGMLSKARMKQCLDGSILPRIEIAKRIVLKDEIRYPGLSTTPLTSRDFFWKNF